MESNLNYSLGVFFMKQRKKLLLAVLAMLLTVVFALAGCGDDTNTGDNSGDIENGTTATDADREIAENDLNKEGAKITLTLTSPKEDEELSGGSVTVSGKAEGDEVKEVKVKMLLDDETVIGEGTAMVADVSHEFTTDIKYSIPDEKRSDNSVNCKIQMTVVGADGNEVKEDTLNIKVK